MWDLIVSVSDHCLSFYLAIIQEIIPKLEALGTRSSATANTNHELFSKRRNSYSWNEEKPECHDSGLT